MKKQLITLYWQPFLCWKMTVIIIISQPWLRYLKLMDWLSDSPRPWLGVSSIVEPEGPVRALPRFVQCISASCADTGQKLDRLM